jgi:hypothetical protein
MNRYDKVQFIIKEILKTVISHDDWEIIDVWLAYRILALEFEQKLTRDLDDFIIEAKNRKTIKTEPP